MAPEMIEQSRGYDYKSDIWSLGITAIEIAEGEAPYMSLTAAKIMITIMKSQPPQLNKNNWSDPFFEFVTKCLQKDPNNRPSA